MKIYDISQEVFDCAVYPGDPRPERTVAASIDEGSMYNLTAFSMCAHNGTHVDAPYHFINDGRKIDELELYRLIGPCYVCTIDGEVGAEEIEALIQTAETLDAECAKRLLFRGNTMISAEAAKALAAHKTFLVGNESQTVGTEADTMRVHAILLEAEIVLLEGIRLADVPDGRYILNAAPINLAGSDGAPCRAILMEL